MTPRKAITPQMKIDWFLWEGHVLCPECRMQILPGHRIEWDHRHCLALDGPHEYQNLRPIHYDPCHKKKSARDVKALAKAKRLAGETCNGPKRKIPSKPFPQRKQAKVWPKRPMRGK